ncbi:alpha/beta fold hydrolase [Nocardia africana]|uniref:alpha/beta fold hydrolase n=1 Tax=Nocardia africana TaxID=134964 RepID=UPI001D1339FB|nr:alpha/beta hydrolase [Nocardia africana]MCC3311357.1 alpha/beta hydrolase [Nocardia africana]
MPIIDTSPLAMSSSDGLMLAGDRCGPTFAAATVVYVHGLLCDGSWWRPLTEQVHDRLDGQIAQIVWDQRGHGRSGRPHRSVETTLDHLADDLDTVLTQATGSVVLVTHSAGSMVAAAYAQRYPARAAALSGLVLFNATGEFPEFPALPRHFMTAATRIKGLRHGKLDHVAAAAASVAERRFRRTARRLGSKAPLATGDRPGDPRVLTDLMHAYRHFYLDPAIAAGLRPVPSFVVTGDRDRVVSATQSTRFAEKIWADQQVVPGAGHSLPRSEPGIAAEVIVAALDVAYRADVDQLLLDQDGELATDTDGTP